MKKRVAIIGTQGVPAQYGGFETLVENMIGENASPEVEYTVLCSSWDYKERLTEYKGAKLEYVPLHANGVQSIPYDMLSLLRVLGRGYDVVLVLGVSGCVVLPLFRWLYRGRLVVNIDGLEHRREKWGRLAKWFLRLSEACAVRAADVVVADNKGIADYVTETYGRESVTIAYGGDHAVREVPQERQLEMLAARGLTPGGYALSLCRIEPENNCHVILEAARKSGQKLVFVGNWNRSDYGRNLRMQYADCPNICTVDAVYELDELYTLRRNCRVYIHGHSAGGTNPSLVEAMHCEVPILAFDVVYNRETTGHQAHYWSSAEELAHVLQNTQADALSANAAAMKQLAHQHYCWQTIARRYESTYA